MPVLRKEHESKKWGPSTEFFFDNGELAFEIDKSDLEALYIKSTPPRKQEFIEILVCSCCDAILIDNQYTVPHTFFPENCEECYRSNATFEYAFFCLECGFVAAETICKRCDLKEISK